MIPGIVAPPDRFEVTLGASTEAVWNQLANPYEDSVAVAALEVRSGTGPSQPLVNADGPLDPLVWVYRGDEFEPVVAGNIAAHEAFWVYQYAGPALKLVIPQPAPAVSEIAVYHCNDINGVALGLGRTVSVTGVVTAEYSSPTRAYFYLQDATAGIAVFGEPLVCLAPGDSVVVTGKIVQFNGLTEVDSTLAISPGEAMGPLGLREIPSTVFIDKNATIIAVAVGEHDAASLQPLVEEAAK